MLGWYRAVCPVDPLAKAWIETRLAWLADQFGADVFTRRAVIVPERDFFPDRYDGSEDAVATLAERVCRDMDVGDVAINLEFFSSRNAVGLVNERGLPLPTAAGLYEYDGDEVTIHLDREEFASLPSLIGTIAHELAHLRLLGEGRLTGDEYDNELLTDLTVVFHGLGLFMANSPRAWPAH